MKKERSKAEFDGFLKMEKTQNETVSTGIFSPLKFILIYMILSFILIGAVIPHTSLCMPNSLLEFIDYSKILENNIPIQACIKKDGGECIGNINITNKQQLIQYINHRYHTDIMKDIEEFIQFYEKHEWLYSLSSSRYVNAYLYLKEREE